jgi:polysaccharide biosynthesis protein PelG
LAGIGFTLERMTAGNSLNKTIAAYFCAAFIIAGPWILTVLGIAGVSFIACDSQCLAVQIFRSVIIYNSLFSLVVTTPIAYVCTRFVSDRLYQKRSDNVMFALFAGLCAFVLVAAITAAPFYVFVTTLNPLERLASLQNLALIGGAWLLIPFLGALQNFEAVLWGFSLGVAVMVGAVAVAPSATPFWLLSGFNAGLCVIDFVMLWRLAVEFGVRLASDRALWGAIQSYWELPVIGVAYGLGLWIDKLIMWFAAPSGTLRVAGALQTMPSYDTPMFWAQLTTVPVVVIFFIHVETRFFRLSRNFYGRIRDRACLRELETLMAELRAFISKSIIGLFAASVVICALAILVSFVAIDPLGLRANQMGILRNALLGMACHACAMFCFIFLLYLDLRRQALALSLAFLILNGALTAAFLPLGFSFYGYGNMVASSFTFALGIMILMRETPWLHFHVFVTTNQSVRQKLARK